MIRYAVAGLALFVLAQPALAQAPGREAMDALIAQHAAANGLPASLIHRVIVRESRYNPRAVGRGGTIGLMQIKHATARGMGYTGSAAGLLDPDINLTYAVRYLAGAYRAANGNANRAVAYYASGYYYAAKRQGLAGIATAQNREPVTAQILESDSAVPSVTTAAPAHIAVGPPPRMDAIH